LDFGKTLTVESQNGTRTQFANRKITQSSGSQGFSPVCHILLWESDNSAAPKKTELPIRKNGHLSNKSAEMLFIRSQFIDYQSQMLWGKI